MLTPPQNAPETGESSDLDHFQRAVETYAGATGRVFDPQLFPELLFDRTAPDVPLSGETLEALEAWTAEQAEHLERRAWSGRSTAVDSLALREAQENLATVRRYRAAR
ncbi:hypothetical protein [Streptomyces natalensis]|uniref:Uncharacterized protein n=1 Tax=Streptomyces natalensis ATCC 27448 TaxID=1240678 RepID=A0A0D7CIE9_9ACTN|nr:hypothetical protein [Streptomyces natalensis]KIZ15640.1 hypothetical protein SNA_25825 [Streptomyces natalensis ATCC 27448]